MTRSELKVRVRVSPDSGVCVECEFSLEPECVLSLSQENEHRWGLGRTRWGALPQCLNTECLWPGSRLERQGNGKTRRKEICVLSNEDNTVTYLIVHSVCTWPSWKSVLFFKWLNWRKYLVDGDYGENQGWSWNLESENLGSVYLD